MRMPRSRNFCIVLALIAVLIAAGAWYSIQKVTSPRTNFTSLSSTPMRLTSSAFQDGDVIPANYSHDAGDVSPPLSWDGVPDGTATFALVMEDPDVPAAAGVPVWIHWVVFNIAPTIRSIPEAWNPEGTRGAGTRGLFDYYGPRPPDREHRYYFRLYAIDSSLGLSEGATRSELDAAMGGHVLAEASLMGRFSP